MKKYIFTIAALIFGLSQMTAQEMIFPEIIEVPQGGSAPLTIKYKTGVNIVDGTEVPKTITTYMFNIVLPDGLSLTQGKTGMDWQMDEKNDVFNTMPDGTTGMACLSTDPNKYFLDGTAGTLGSVGIEAAAKLAIDTELEVKATQLAFSEYVGGNYETINFDDVVIKVKIIDNRITLDENSTTAPTAAENVNVKVLRTISANNNWNTICLPFAMTGEQVKAAFGDGVKFANFTGYEINDDETELKVNFASFDASAGLEANHPCLIQVENRVTEFNVDNVTIAPENKPTIATIERTKRQWSEMIGTYVAETVLDDTYLFISGNNFYYGNAEGKTKMKAYRAYFDFYDELKDKAAAAKVGFNVDGEATSIDGYAITRSVEGVYDLSGRKIKLENGDVTKLQKGVYIIDGKKVTIK